MFAKLDNFYWKMRGKIASLAAASGVCMTIAALTCGAGRMIADEQITQLTDKATNAMNSGTDALTRIAMAALPIALIALLVIVMINHDPRSLKTQVGACLVVIVAAVAIILVKNGAVLDLVGELAGDPDMSEFKPEN